MESRFYNYTVLPQDIDCTTKARFTTLIRALLDTAGEDARVNGFGIQPMAELNLGWVLSRLAVEIDCRPMEHEAYRIETWVADYGSLTTNRCFRFWDADGNCFGRAVSQWCLIDYSARRLAPISKLVNLIDGTTTDQPFPCDPPMKIKAFEAETCFSRTVKYTDIDFNGHMNTLRYLDMLADELPMEIATGDRKLRADLHFVKESVYGDVLNLAKLEESPVSEDGVPSYRMSIRKDDGTLVILATLSFK
ncbi:MAG: acyl-[acyl-carrier-protein] thioesterase [Candidatus Cryptobacteroides sp.]